VHVNTDSRDLKLQRELDSVRSEFKTAEELLWESRLEKEEKCKKLEMEIEALKRKRGVTINS
jgi:hypothetical protein